MHGANERSTKDKRPSTELLQKWTRLCSKRRGFRNKGALLVLVWNFSAFLIFVYPFSSTFNVQLGLLASMLLYPIVGWLADVYFGRYTVIKYSMWIMWCSAVISNVWILVKHYNHNSVVLYTMEILSNGAGFVGLAGFQSNAIQFGVDQLVDASSSEISSYISWYIWIFFLGKSIVVLTQHCFCVWFKKSWTYFIIPLSCTISLVSDALLNKWLVKEPVAHNPLKLIYQVLKYAIKNKYPRLRSAFTYWDDKPYLRIDLAKTKYGGPFSTEQVENVKSFFRILILAAAASLFIGSFVGLYHANKYMQFHYRDDNYLKNCSMGPSPSAFMGNCFFRSLVKMLSYFVIVVFVPLFELLMYPLITKYAPCIGNCIIYRFLLGVFLALVYCLCLVGFEVAAINNALGKNNNTICLFQASDRDLLHRDVVNLNYKWLMLPQIFIGFSFYLLYTSGMEFVYAQTPYAMKGLLMGVVYCTCSISIGMIYSYIELVKKVTQLSRLVLFKENCGLWYYGSIALFSILFLLVGLVIKKKYTLRRRDDDTHNEQIFAVEYFEKYIG